MESRTEVTLNMRGRRVGLGPLCRENLPVVTRWMNDWEVTRTLAAGTRPVTAEAQQKWLEKRSDESNVAIFHLYALDPLTLVGNCGLHDIDHRHQSAELGIVIGEKEHWGRGLATEACQLLLRHAFEDLGLHSVFLWAYANNARALRAYARAGFREVGRRRQALRQGQELVDLVLFDCLATDRRGAAEPA